MNFFPSTSKAVAIAMAFAVLGCQPASENPSPPSWGAIMPIQVGASSSTWMVQDWLAPGETVDHIAYCTSPDAFDTLLMQDGQITLPDAPSSGLGVLKLTVQGEERMVPVLSKGEVRHTFTFDASLTPQPKSSLKSWETSQDGPPNRQ